MARRGFFAELQYQARMTAREEERRERQAVRDHAVMVRRLEQAQKAEERARAQLTRAADAERKRLEKEAKEAHLETMEAEVAKRNQELQEFNDDVESLLASTLGKDDFVDLKTLRVIVTHPPFDRSDLETPPARPAPIPYPDKPVLTLPEEPRGLASFFSRKKHAEAVEHAERTYERALTKWQSLCREVDARRKTAENEYIEAGALRLKQLEAERARYAKECSAREAEAAVQNRRLAMLITNLGYGTAEAVQEYVSIVLSNSVYPEHFQVEHEFELDPGSAELRLRVSVPPPDALTEVKAYKYSKSADEITSTDLSKKQCRDRYAGAVHQVALRTFHEIFESDRRALIKTISLEVGTNTNDPATGLKTYVPFVIAAAERETFLTFDLSAVVPSATLVRLGAAFSKNPYALVAAERSGVRRA